MIDTPDKVSIGKRIGLAASTLLLVASTHMPFITRAVDAASLNIGRASIPTAEPVVWPSVPGITDLEYAGHNRLIIKTQDGTASSLSAETGEVDPFAYGVEAMAVYEDKEGGDIATVIGIKMFNAEHVLVSTDQEGIWTAVKSQGEIPTRDVSIHRILDIVGNVQRRNLISYTDEQGQVYWAIENNPLHIPSMLIEAIREMHLEEGDITNQLYNLINRGTVNEEAQNILDAIDNGTEFTTDGNGNIIINSADWYARAPIDVSLFAGVSAEVVAQDKTGRVAAIVNHEWGNGDKTAAIAYGNAVPDGFGGMLLEWDGDDGSGHTLWYSVDPLHSHSEVSNATVIGCEDGFVTIAYDRKNEIGKFERTTVSVRSKDEDFVGFAYPKIVAVESNPAVEMKGESYGPTRVMSWEGIDGSLTTAAIGMIYGDVYGFDSVGGGDVGDWDTDTVMQDDYIDGFATAAFDNGEILDYEINVNAGNVVFMPYIVTTLVNRDTGESGTEDGYWEGVIKGVPFNNPYGEINQ